MSRKPQENKLIIRNSTAEFLIFTQQAGEGGIEVRYEEGSIWLTQKLIAELFGVTTPTINEHLKNIFESQELDQNSVIRKFLTTANDGKNYNTQYYNLDAIISVGYRVNSKRATQFLICHLEFTAFYGLNHLMSVKFCEMQEKLAQKLLKIILRVSLKNTASYKIDFLNQILIKRLKLLKIVYNMPKNEY